MTNHNVRLVATILLLLGAVTFGLTALAQQEGGQPSPEEMEAMAQRAAELGLPEGTIQLTPCVAGMGQHWANPQDMPLGPIYGVLGDELVFVEILQERYLSHFL